MTQFFCDRCGAECTNGYEERQYGRRDTGNGYANVEVVCNACLDEEAADDLFELKYEAGDAAMELAAEDACEW